MLGLVDQQCLARGFHRSMLLCEKRANWHKLCRNQFNALKRVRALLKKEKARDRDEKMMTVERSYQRSIADTKVWQACSSVSVSLTSIHSTSTFNLSGTWETIFASLKTHHYSVKAKRGFYSTWCTASRVPGVKNQTVKQTYDDSTCYAGTALTAGTGFFTYLKKPKWFSVHVFWAI